MTLNALMAVTLHCVISLNLVNLRCRKRSVAEFMQESIAFLVRVQCRRKESSRSLSHLLMSFLFYYRRPHICNKTAINKWMKGVYANELANRNRH